MLAHMLVTLINNIHVNITLDITITVAVAVGIREWLIRPYLERVEALEAEVEDLKKRLSHLEHVEQKVALLEERLKVLDLLTDQAKENRLWLRELLKDIEDIRLEIEALKLKSGADSLSEEKPDEVELEARVYELITKGYHSPTKLATALGISKDKLYRILRRLQEARLITTKGKGRKKKYVPRIEAEAE